MLSTIIYQQKKFEDGASGADADEELPSTSMKFTSVGAMSTVSVATTAAPSIISVALPVENSGENSEHEHEHLEREETNQRRPFLKRLFQCLSRRRKNLAAVEIAPHTVPAVIPAPAAEQNSRTGYQVTASKKEPEGVEVEEPAEEANYYLLEEQTPAMKGRKCLVLDLDETLVHSSFRVNQFIP